MSTSIYIIHLFTTIHKSSGIDPRHWSKPTAALGLSIPKEDFPRFPEDFPAQGKVSSWMVFFGDLAWFSTSNDMQNNALCCHPPRDQHPDHVIQIIAHHPIQPSDHQPWCDQCAAYHAKSCHIDRVTGHHGMSSHLILLHPALPGTTTSKRHQMHKFGE